MAFPKKTAEQEQDAEVVFRSAKPRLRYHAKPERKGENPEPAVVVRFENGICRTSDPFIIKKLRKAIDKQPVGIDAGLKGIVTEVKEGDAPNPELLSMVEEGKE
jgi:hypothetical protein